MSIAEDEDDWLLDDDDDAGVGAGADNAAGAPFAAAGRQPPWRVLVVDDDPDVHAVTRLALRNVSFKERELELFSAYSGAEGYQMLANTADIALVLLDVVMETEDAGLVLARRIREELGNTSVRVVLRTGQPGQAPEQRVIVDYDINDYKSKTELTTHRLFTAVVSALRAYETLTLLERSRAGLGRILEGVTNLYQGGSLREFASGVLGQVSAVLGIGGHGMLCVLAMPGREPAVLAATGIWTGLADPGVLPADHALAAGLRQVLADDHPLHTALGTILPIQTMQQQRLGIAVSPPLAMADVQRELLELYCQRIAAAFDNQYLVDQVKKTELATVALLAQASERRCPGSAAHAERVRELSVRIAARMLERGASDPELTPQLVAMIGLASMLHDIGMDEACDGLPDDAVYTPAQRAQMRRHPDIGRQQLERAADSVGGVSYLTFGMHVAGAHQEHWDGGGYPNGLAGRAIPLCARIVGAADAFDALVSERAYKRSMPQAEALAVMREQAGRQFDPEVVAALLEVAGPGGGTTAPATAD